MAGVFVLLGAVLVYRLRHSLESDAAAGSSDRPDPSSLDASAPG